MRQTMHFPGSINGSPATGPALPLAPPRVTPAFLNRPKQPFLTAVSNYHNSGSACKNSDILTSFLA